MSTDKRPIFITGRFRSGTSFLWQLFDQLDGYCAWYEPLHPQLLTAIHYVTPKEDHVGVKDYWSAYRQHPSFANKYSSDFATRQVYLEEKNRYRALAAYIKHLIMLSGDQVPVLQFNRVDLRLGWLRQMFPEARILHIERNPLQLYHSQRKHINAAVRDQADYWDAYELMPWCHSLYQNFPFLLNAESEQHAFYRFYALYQLSHWLGHQKADLTINLDVDVFQSDRFIDQLNRLVPLSQDQRAVLKAMKHVPQQRTFPDPYVEDMANIMTAVDLQLADAGLAEYFGKRALSAIKFHHAEYWGGIETPPQDLFELLSAVQKLAKEVDRIHQENQYYLREIATLSDGTHQLEGLPESILEVEKINKPSQPTAENLLAYSNQLNNAMTQVLAINAYLDPEFYALKDAADAREPNHE